MSFEIGCLHMKRQICLCRSKSVSDARVSLCWKQTVQNIRLIASYLSKQWSALFAPSVTQWRYFQCSARRLARCVTDDNLQRTTLNILKCPWLFFWKTGVVDFLQAKCDIRGKTAVLRFEPPLGDLGATYDNHLRLIGKRVVDFLLVLIELFFSLDARSYGWGATSDYQFKIGDFSPTGVGWPKISGRRGRPTKNSFSQKH